MTLYVSLTLASPQRWLCLRITIPVCSQSLASCLAVGKANMGPILNNLIGYPPYRMLCAFGLDGTTGSLREGVRVLQEMQSAAEVFAEATEGWDPSRLGLFLHCYPHNSVQSLHLHMVDLGATGPTFEAMREKNLPLGEALEVLETELEKAIELE